VKQNESAISSLASVKSLGQYLLGQRLSLGLSQEALAEAIGVSARSIRRWEQDQAIPQALARERLCAIFGTDSRFMLGAVSSRETTSIMPPLWHVPLPRNPFFTGREELLQALHERLKSEQRMALTQSWAISGLGGIGKTQIALEYAYQHARDYAAVFWISAATQETLQAGLVTVAESLQLPEKDDHDQTRVIRAVSQWLVSHQDWLLILDNADEVAIVRDVLPAQRSGHLLLTTRAQALGAIAQRMEIETMGMAEGTLFLLRRAKLLAPDAFLDQASPEHLAATEAIVIEMDFLPLALDQAGAYIEEVGCSLAGYLDLYRTHRTQLLQRRGHAPGAYPESVATTWSVNFQHIVQVNPAAAELLRLYAYLAPDAIPEELISESGAALGPVLGQVATDAFALNGAIEELRKFSLVQRDPEARLLRLHRLVQTVLKDAMKREDQCQWAERAVRATSMAFPQTVERETWPLCQHWLPQAQACSVLIQGYTLVFEEAATLLQRTATYLYDAALNEQAASLYQQALHLWEQVTGPDSPQVASVLEGLALVFKALGKYTEAEPLFLRTLSIQEQIVGPEHPEVARSLTMLASISFGQEKYEQAESLCQRALRIQEQTLRPEHPEVARSLHTLASIYHASGNYEHVESLYRRALRIREQALGTDHPDVAGTLYNLARLSFDQGRYEQAELLFLRTLRIWEQAFGPEHPDVVYALNALAGLYHAQGKYEQAEPLFQRTLRIWEQALGPEHSYVAHALHGLASLYSDQEKYEQAEQLYQRALRIWEQALGPEHSYVAHALHGLAVLYGKRGMDQQAEALYQRALSIREQALGKQHLETAETLHDFAAFRETQNRSQEAAALYQRALAIREQILGVQHPTTTATRTAYLAVLPTREREDQERNELS
jgi:tetratricopeptide (TPR) repeat protein/DNA-binding XRE family transcriptional regulator